MKNVMPGHVSLKKWLLRTAAIIFLALNVIAALHAWRFTHFTDSREARVDHSHNLSWPDKITMALTGVPNPRPETKRLPVWPYATIYLQSSERMECWYISATAPAKGTVILFHGYGGEKSGMLDKACLLIDAGYNVFLPDFCGGGGSGGSTVTIGYREAADVRICCDYIRSLGEQRMVLLGTSMGAAAVLKYLNDGGKQPAGIILECPFGTMYQTVCDRFHMLHVPEFPMAGLLVFWGGIENGFWAFGHNPETYAEAVHCPALLLWGEQDDRVTRGETDRIFASLAGRKTLRTYPLAGHSNYLQQYKSEWNKDIQHFLLGL